MKNIVHDIRYASLGKNFVLIGLVRSFGGATELEPVAPPPAPRRIFCLSAVPCNAAPQGFLYGSAASARGQHDGAKRIVRAVLRF